MVKAKTTTKSGTKSAAVAAKEASPKSQGRKKGSAKKLKEVAEKKSDEGHVVVKGRNDSPTDTIYLGHVPLGFGEAEMRKFFMQFGDVSKLKLFRSKKTKGSKGYAFIKFDSVTTAGTVSEAMNGYFMGDRQLVSEVVPKWKCHKGMFLQPRKRKEGEEVGKSSTDMDVYEEEDQEKIAKMARKAKKNLSSKQKKLAALGIEYDFVEDLVSKGLDKEEKSETKTKTKTKTSAAAKETKKKRKAAESEDESEDEAEEKESKAPTKAKAAATKKAKTAATAAPAKGKGKGKAKK